MMNTEEDLGEEYDIDGAYFPRIYFLDENGKIQTEIYNEAGNPEYKYYYANKDALVNRMRIVLEKFSPEIITQVKEEL
jgi:hypothetical protein